LKWQRAYRLEPVFAKIGAAAIPRLLPLLDDPKATVRNFAVAAVAMIRPIDPAAVAGLRSMLRDDDWRIKASAARKQFSASEYPTARRDRCFGN
jgi:HEAT repeat protein